MTLLGPFGSLVVLFCFAHSVCPFNPYAAGG